MVSVFCCSLLLTLVPAQAPSLKEAPRLPHPLAPSLPLLTDAEYAQIDDVIDRFILYDTGKLKGAEGRKALLDFHELGPEAIFPLIAGLNKAANLEDSCPAVLIGKKLARLLGASRDVELLEYARENIGAGVTARRHTVVIKDLRVGCMLQKSAVQRSQAAASLDGRTPLRALSIADLAAAASEAKGPKLKLVLAELEKRKGLEVIETLAIIAARPQKDGQSYARSLLLRHLFRQSAKTLKEKLRDERAEVRAAAALVVGSKKLPWGFELIDMLGDAEMPVCQAARRALVQLAQGADFGPSPQASPSERSASTSRWREWWSQR